MSSAAVPVESILALNGESSNKGTGVFEKTENVSDLEPVLKSRLPISANIFNICKNHSKWSKDVNWYVFEGRISSGSWIVATYKRDDLGFEISVSRPSGIPVKAEIREAFSKATFIDWAEPFYFASIDTEISAIITDISVRDKGNYTHVLPCNLYYMDIEDAIRLNDNFGHGEGVEVKSIGNAKGEDFILSTWKFASKGSDTYAKYVLERNLSSGVYVDGKIVSGVVFAVHGLISMLYTLNEYRGKGFAQSAMYLIMKNSAENGLVPSCAVQQRNEVSNAFQTKIGFKLAGVVDYLQYEKPAF